MIRLVILFATLAIALPFVIAKAGLPFGTAVSQRFLERETNDSDPRSTIPPEAKVGDQLAAESLATWVREHAERARGYAQRVIPLDIVYLVCLGVFLAIASVTLRDLTLTPSFFPRIPNWVCWLLPCIYVVCDFSEDFLIILLLTWPETIKGVAFQALSLARSIKITSVGLAFVQVLLLCVMSYVWPATSKL
ncbi:hypothetical protein ACVWZR_002606 [Bradyrhizobium sp. i1.3.1]